MRYKVNHGVAHAKTQRGGAKCQRRKEEGNLIWKSGKHPPSQDFGAARESREGVEEKCSRKDAKTQRKENFNLELRKAGVGNRERSLVFDPVNHVQKLNLELRKAEKIIKPSRSRGTNNH